MNLINKQLSEPAQDRTRRRIRLSECIKRALYSYGYIEIDLPVYEYYDLLKETVYGFSDESIIRFIDRNTGKSLVLRPDFTPQVCRAVTGYMNDYPFPLRICYSGEVFRSSHSEGERKTDSYQIGWELFGDDEFSGDIEIFLTSSRALKNAGLKDFIFAVGDARFLARIFEIAGEAGDEVKNALAGKKRHDIKNIIKKYNLSGSFSDILLMLPMAFGGNEVIESLKNTASFDEILTSRLEYISRLFTHLYELGIDKNSLVFDACESKGVGYYTGVNFDILHEGAGFSLGGGGRYDNLMEKFGKNNLSACGAALKIAELMQFGICGDDGQHYDWLVLGSHNLAKAEELRNKGESVFYSSDISRKEEFLKIYNFNNIYSDNI